MRSDTVPGGVGVVTTDVPPEHTVSVSNDASQTERIAMRLLIANMDDMSGSSLCDWAMQRARFSRKIKKPPRHRLIVGFAGGSAGIAEIRSSPVALRHRLSTALL